MKILMLTQWFDPEPCFKGLAFAQALRRQGHEVAVLTGFPNYPSGKIYPNYRQGWRVRERADGITVTRVPLYPSHDRSAVRRMLNYVSFAVSALLSILFEPRPDLVYVYSPPPSTALGAVALKMARKVPFVLDVQDLWPDALGATGMVNSPLLKRVINWWVGLVYRKAGRIIVLSPGYRRTLIERGVPPERVEVIPNWTHENDRPTGTPSQSDGDVFEIVFAGNMGPAQQLETIVEAAAILRDEAPDVRFTLVGDGIDADRLAARVAVEGLENIRLPGRVPPSAMADIFAAADALLVHLRDEPVFAMTIPSKTQAYLRAGKPILMGVRGDAADLVLEARAGIVFTPGDARALADASLRLKALSPAERAAMGAAGSDYYERHLSLEAGAGRFGIVFGKVLAECTVSRAPLQSAKP